MTNEEKRRHAAATLVVSDKATPKMVTDAYKRRLKQYWDFNDSDPQLFLRKTKELYDAYVLMSHAPNKQYIAQAKLAMRGEVYKIYQTILAQMSILRGMTDDSVAKILWDDIAKHIEQLYRRYRLFRALCIYELSGLGGMFVFDHIKPEHDLWIPMAVYGSMLVAGFALGFVMDSIDKKKNQIISLTTLFKIMQKIR